jgi:hypothetical protein
VLEYETLKAGDFMGVTVLKATQYDKVIMENLLQFYTYDFTELTNTAISGKVTERLENGRRYQSFVCCINQK